MVLPLAIDLQITPRKTFLPKSRLGEQTFGRIVGRQARGFDAMEPQCLENEGHKRAHRVEHIALSGEALADPIAERAALRDAAANVRQCTAAKQRIVFGAKDEER